MGPLFRFQVSFNWPNTDFLVQGFRGFDSHARTRLAWLMKVCACYWHICGPNAQTVKGTGSQVLIPQRYIETSTGMQQQAGLPCFKTVTGLRDGGFRLRRVHSNSL